MIGACGRAAASRTLTPVLGASSPTATSDYRPGSSEAASRSSVRNTERGGVVITETNDYCKNCVEAHERGDIKSTQVLKVVELNKARVCRRCDGPLPNFKQPY